MFSQNQIDNTLLAHSDDAHSKYSPSKSHLWLNCAKAADYYEEMAAAGKIKTSAAAQAGRDKHRVLEFFLKKHGLEYFDADKKRSYKNFMYALNYSGSKEKIFSRDKMTLNLYKALKELNREVGKVVYSGFESRVDLSFILPGCFGTADLVYIGSKENNGEDESTLWVIDYKFGRVEVSPESSQLLLYGAGMHRSLDDFYLKIKLCIIQPELESKLKVKEMSIKNMDFWIKQLKGMAAKNTLDKKKRKANVGSWCENYAMCRLVCPEYKKKSLKEVSDDFERMGL